MWLFTFFQKAMFKKARTVFPFYKQLGWRPKTSEYRRVVGTIELVCGLILMLVPGKQLRALYKKFDIIAVSVLMACR